MLASILWFIALLALAGACHLLGRWVGRKPKAVAQIAVFVAVGLIGLAALPRFRPGLVGEYLPLWLFVRLEGVFGVLPWMALVGVLATSKLSTALRRSVPLLLTMGVVYFLYGAIWMVLPVIHITEPENRSANDVTLQSRHDSCVPSASATAMRRLGISATESQMCDIVQAKSNRGSTLVRAAWGLKHFLEQYNIDVSLEDLTLEEVVEQSRRNQPILITVKSSLAADHMIAVLGPYGRDILIANPSPFGDDGTYKALPIDLGDGLEVFSFDEMRRMYRRGAIVFTPRVTRVRE